MDLRRVLSIGLAWAALLLSGAHAGEIKYHARPCSLVRTDLCTVPVVLDKEADTRCTVSAGTITLQPVAVGVFEGCSTVRVTCCCNLTLTCEVVPTGVVKGNYSVSLSKSDVDAPGGTAKLCVKLTDAVPGGQPSLSKHSSSKITVAKVLLTVSPRPGRKRGIPWSRSLRLSQTIASISYSWQNRRRALAWLP